jgi:acetyltransferase-like isoleucine patch superfamily enzyme
VSRSDSDTDPDSDPDPVVVGLGANLLQRIVVGEHTVVGAGSTVTRNLPAYAVAYGSPARVMRQRQAGERYL